MNRDGLAPGIYFSLPASLYHADAALSRSQIMALNDTPFTYWEQSWMNPCRKPRRISSEEMAFGEAFHCQLFEPARFERDYFVFPTEKWDAGRIMISRDDYDEIVAAIKVLLAGKDSRLFLSGGMSEVTIVFDYCGHRFRTRHDFLSPVVTTDFKTSFSIADWHIKRSFEKFGYDTQMALYRLSRRRFKEQFQIGEAHVYGRIDEPFFKRFMESEIDDFVFVIQRSSPPYPFEVLLPEADTESSGMGKIERGMDIYTKNYQKFGTKPWPISDGKIKRFSMIYGKIEEN